MIMFLHTHSKSGTLLFSLKVQKISHFSIVLVREGLLTMVLLLTLTQDKCFDTITSLQFCCRYCSIQVDHLVLYLLMLLPLVQYTQTKLLQYEDHNISFTWCFLQHLWLFLTLESRIYYKLAYFWLLMCCFTFISQV